MKWADTFSHEDAAHGALAIAIITTFRYRRRIYDAIRDRVRIGLRLFDTCMRWYGIAAAMKSLYTFITITSNANTTRASSRSRREFDLFISRRHLINYYRPLCYSKLLILLPFYASTGRAFKGASTRSAWNLTGLITATFRLLRAWVYGLRLMAGQMLTQHYRLLSPTFHYTATPHFIMRLVLPYWQ